MSQPISPDDYAMAALVTSVVVTAIICLFAGLAAGIKLASASDRKAEDAAFELGKNAGYAKGHYDGFKACQQQESRGHRPGMQGLPRPQGNPALANQHDGRSSRKWRFSPKPLRRGE